MLVPEDRLRLAILLRQEFYALRVDEGKMRIHALTPSGEAGIQLKPERTDARYLRAVHEVIASQVLGVPHGYPNYLKRWTRAGQARSHSLAALLKLGEPEALAAVVHAEGLTDELARRAWWVLQSPEHARAMLARDTVANGTMGPILAEFLVEFLGHEDQVASIVDSVRLVLQPGLISSELKAELWRRGQRRSAYRVGFLHTLPDELPVVKAPHPALLALRSILCDRRFAGNPYALQLQRLLDGPGQAFLEILRQTLLQSNDKWVVIRLFQAVSRYFQTTHPGWSGDAEIRAIAEALRYPESCFAERERLEAWRILYEQLPVAQRPLLEGVLLLSCLNEAVLEPVLGNNEAVGAGLRRLLEPVTQVVIGCIDGLRYSGDPGSGVH
jgi:hypothetical protein